MGFLWDLNGIMDACMLDSCCATLQYHLSVKLCESNEHVGGMCLLIVVMQNVVRPVPPKIM